MHHRVGTLVHVSGHLPLTNDGVLKVGRVGEDGVGMEEGYEAAKLCGMNLLSTMEHEFGLDAIDRVVKIFGIVNSSPDFHEHHLVMNGCSDLMIQVFGEKHGYHARSAIGTSVLPLGMSVEVEAIFKLKDEYITELSSLRDL